MFTLPALCVTKPNSVEIVYIDYKNLRYNFNKSTVKIDRREFFSSTHATACDFSALLHLSSSETLHENLSVVLAKQPRRKPRRKPKKYIFLVNQRDGIRTFLELFRQE